MRSLPIYIILAATLAAQVAEGDGPSIIPDYAPLAELPLETSVFLINDFEIPADVTHETVTLAAGGSRRVDYFVEGKRVPRRNVALSASYCAVISDGDSQGFTEKSKSFQIVGLSAPIPAPREGERGVSVKLKSVQHSTIHAITCYQPEQSVVPLTVRILRYMVRTQADDVSLALMAPVGVERAPASETSHTQFIHYVTPGSNESSR